MIWKSYPEFGIKFDGTPSFAKVEAIKIRFVDHNFEIMELLVKVSCFKNKLNLNNIIKHVVHTIFNELDLSLKDWRASQQGKASTNSAVLRKLKETVIGANPTRNDCCSYTFSNSVKAMIEGNHAPNDNMFRNYCQGMIQYPGAARDLTKAVMGETVAESGGVRFFKNYEKIQQIDTHGPSVLLKNVVK